MENSAFLVPENIIRIFQEVNIRIKENAIYQDRQFETKISEIYNLELKYPDI